MTVGLILIKTNREDGRRLYTDRDLGENIVCSTNANYILHNIIIFYFFDFYIILLYAIIICIISGFDVVFVVQQKYKSI